MIHGIHHVCITFTYIAKVAMASTTTLLLSLVFLFFSTLNFMPLLESSHNNSDIAFNNNNTNDGFSIPLIHRDSPLSPLYNHSKTPHETRISQLKHSISRMNYLSSLSESTQISYDPKSYLYIASYYIGTPPQKVFAFIDTASDLIWTNSKTAFKSGDSSTFISLPCNEKNYCKKLPDNQRTCRKNNDPCTYILTYKDGTSTTGVISQDKFRFDVSRDLGTVTFGYANEASSEHFKGKDINGCLGLSPVAPFSLITQLGIKKFSHCLIQDESKSSRMRFGSEAVIDSENSTPLVAGPNPKLYYVNLEGINVGDKKVPGTPRQFGSIYVDTGASYSILKETVFTPFLKLVKELVAKPSVVPPSPYDKELEYCFKATEADVKDLPKVTFHFTSVDVTFANDVTYMEIDDEKGGIWCLAIMKSSEKDDSVLGNFQMTNLNVGYDREKNRMSFTRADCEASTAVGGLVQAI